MAEITWVKLKTDMFDNDKIKLIEALPDADTIIVIWVKLLASAGRANSNGYIMLTENIPMNVEEMATIFNRPLNTVRLALSTFTRYGMIEVENEVIKIKNWEVHQNIEGMDRVRKLNAERNKKYRERKKQIELPHPPSENNHSNVSMTSRDGTEKDLDLDIDLDIKKEEQEQQTKVGQSVRPSSDFAKLVDFTNNNIQPVAQAVGEKLGFMLDDYKDADLIIEALKESIMKPDVKNKYTYAEGILRNWKNELITNLEQLNAKRTREANQHGSNGISNGRSHAKATGKGIDDVYRQLERDKQAWGD